MQQPQVRFRVFHNKSWYWNVTGLLASRVQIRKEAEEFINTAVGAENVISIQETVTSSGPYSVIVWFKEKA